MTTSAAVNSSHCNAEEKRGGNEETREQRGGYTRKREERREERANMERREEERIMFELVISTLSQHDKYEQSKT